MLRTTAALIAALAGGLATGAPLRAQTAHAARPAPPPTRTAHAPAPSGPPPAPRPATPASDPDALYYLTRDRVQLYRTADSLRPVTLLPLRTSVYRLGTERGWTHVRTEAGVEGYVYGMPLSNVWVRVSKSERTLQLYRGAELVRTFGADFGYNPVANKERRGSTTDRDAWRTPEGTFYVARLNARSQFYKAFVLSYPNADHAARGLRGGLISQREHDAIVEAERTFGVPPMGTALGGMIEIHGKGTGAGVNWTQGCVALRNADVDALWPHLTVGTPVVIEP